MSHARHHISETIDNLKNISFGHGNSPKIAIPYFWGFLKHALSFLFSLFRTINSVSTHFRVYPNPFSFVPSLVPGVFFPEKLSAVTITEASLMQKQGAQPRTLGWVHSGSDTRNLKHHSKVMFRRTVRELGCGERFLAL